MGLELIRGRRSQAGFSLIEGLIAALIALIIILGVLPLFALALRSNLSGAESTSVANLAQARAEEYYQYPFNDSPELTIPVGSDQLVVDEVWTREDDGWIAGTEASALADGKTPIWTRRTRVRQFNVNDLLAGEGPLDGGADPQQVQLKEIEVAVAGTRQAGNPLGGGKALTVRVYKSQ